MSATANGGSPRQILVECRRLLSVRGEADSPTLAAAIVERIDALDDAGRSRFFERLASDFSPDPKLVLAAAQAYATQPDAAAMIRLAHVAEPPRQELFRRLNRAPGGTSALVRLRRRLLESGRIRAGRPWARARRGRVGGGRRLRYRLPRPPRAPQPRAQTVRARHRARSAHPG